MIRGPSCEVSQTSQAVVPEIFVPRSTNSMDLFVSGGLQFTSRRHRLHQRTARPLRRRPHRRRTGALARRARESVAAIRAVLDVQFPARRSREHRGSADPRRATPANTRTASARFRLSDSTGPQASIGAGPGTSDRRRSRFRHRAPARRGIGIGRSIRIGDRANFAAIKIMQLRLPSPMSGLSNYMKAARTHQLG